MEDETGDDNLPEVIAWIREYLRLSEGTLLTSATRINLDLGVDGEDGDEFMLAFGERFNIDASYPPSGRHFGPEAASNPFMMLASLVRMLVGRHPSNLTPLTVQDLVDTIHQSRS